MALFQHYVQHLVSQQNGYFLVFEDICIRLRGFRACLHDSAMPRYAGTFFFLPSHEKQRLDGIKVMHAHEVSPISITKAQQKTDHCCMHIDVSFIPVGRAFPPVSVFIPARKTG